MNKKISKLDRWNLTPEEAKRIVKEIEDKHGGL